MITWFTGVALYLPRVLFGLPCVLPVPLCWHGHTPALDAARAAVIVVFADGAQSPRPIASAGATPLRVLSYNIASCAAGEDAPVAVTQQYSPDVVLMQEVCFDSGPLAERLRRIYPRSTPVASF